MSRTARIDIPEHFYHIMCRGQRKNPLFFSKKDKEYFILLLLSILQEYDILLLAYSLMTNHFHLLVYRRMDSLGIIMKKLNIRYAIYFNKKYNVVGHVFQGRYKSSIVLDEKYLVHLIKYIHDNPVKAGIVKKAEDYEFSSAAFYLGKTSSLPLEKLSIFKGIDGIKRYKEFMNEKEVPISYYKDSIGSTEEYLDLQKRKKGRKLSNYEHRRNGEKKDIYRDTKAICASFKINYDEFINSKWKKNYSQTALKIIIRLLKLGYTQSDIARLLSKSRSIISRLLKK